MFTMRSAVVALAVGALPLAAGCNKGGSPSAATPGSEPLATSPPDDASQAMDDMPPVPAVRKAQLRASLEGVDDMLAAIKDISTRVTPESAFDPLAQVQAALLSSGFGPGFLNNIDLDGLHAFAFGIPHDGGNTIADYDIAGAIGVGDARRVLEGMPPSLRPQPLGEGLWSLRIEDGGELLFREADKELRVGLNERDLARADGLRARAGTGARIRAHAEELPTEAIDVYNLLDLDRRTPNAFADRLTEVVKQLTALDLAIDYGTERDFYVVGSADAPFARLGIETLGAPRAAATAIEARLPGGPSLVTTLAFGNPALLHQIIDRNVPVDQIPQPFAGIVKDTITGTHAVLDGIASDVVAAIYLDGKGQATLVLAADVKSESGVQDGLRKIDEALVAALGAHAVLQGKNEGGKFIVDWKPGSVGLPGVKGDRLAVDVPLDYREDFEPFALFLDKKHRLEAVSFVRRGTAVLALGTGAKEIAGAISRAIDKSPKDSLAQAPALERVRTVLGGCQVCVTFDVADYLRYRLLLLQKLHAADKDLGKQIREQLVRLGKLGDVHEPSAGLRVQASQGAAGFVVPKAVLLAPGEHLIALKEINEFVDITTSGYAVGVRASSTSGP